jgi:hypothetical protein
MRLRRLQAPEHALWERAKKRAAERNVEFSLPKAAITIPEKCPALGIPIFVGQARTENSPSLDRIEPRRGYVLGNVRVISDRANRLKSNRSLAELRLRAAVGPSDLRTDYELVAAYVERETLLHEVARKARLPGHEGEEWRKIRFHLERLFARMNLVEAVKRISSNNKDEHSGDYDEL